MNLRIIGFLLLIQVSAAILPPAAAVTPPADILEACELCDRTDLRPIEGLWSYPEDDVTVLIFRSDEAKGLYDILVVESADCSMNPGMKLGELHESADPDKYRMKLFTLIKNGLLSAPCEATATYSEAKESLTVKKNAVKFKLSPNRLLPYFWRIASVSVKSREPAPEGMIKIYPSYDGNNSTKRAPRYL